VADRTAPDELVMDYAAGALSPAAAALMAAHLEMRPDAARTVAALEAVGGDALERAPARPMAARAQEVILKAPHRSAMGGFRRAPAPDVPRAIARLFPDGSEEMAWKTRWPGLFYINSPLAPGARLIRAKPGATLPRHSHDGSEITLVLTGGFSDGAAHYGPGDIALADADTEHELRIDDDAECLCFTAIDGGLRLSGAMGAVLSLVGLGKL